MTDDMVRRMRQRISTVLAVILATITLGAGLAGPAQAESAAVPIIAQAPGGAGCASGVDSAVCETPGSRIVPADAPALNVKAVQAASAADCWAMRDRLCLYTRSSWTGTMNSYRHYGGSAAGYRLLPVMYNHVRSVINNTDTGWWFHDQGDCNGGTRIYLGPYQSWSSLTVYKVDGDWWYDRISSVTFVNNGTYC